MGVPGHALRHRTHHEAEEPTAATAIIFESLICKPPGVPAPV